MNVHIYRMLCICSVITLILLGLYIFPIHFTNEVETISNPVFTAASKSVNANSPTGKYDLKTHEVYVFGIQESNKEICSNSGAGVKLILVATSAPENYQQRIAVRNTWFTYRTKYKGLVMSFLIGATENTTLQANIERENSIHGDIIQGKILDTYDNLTLKSISLLEWGMNNCPVADFILKTDDDAFINVPILMDILESIDKSERKIYGFINKYWGPNRHIDSKYYLSPQQYAKDKLPFFPQGLAILFPLAITKEFFNASISPDRYYIKLEDVYTGITCEIINVQPVNIPYFTNKKYTKEFDFSLCELQRGVSFHLKQNITKLYLYWNMFVQASIDDAAVHYNPDKTCPEDKKKQPQKIKENNKN